MASFIKFIIDSGVVGWITISCGMAALALIAERVKTLYFTYGMNTQGFSEKITALIAQRKYDEAILVCNKLETKPLARAFKMVLEKVDREDEALYQAADIALAENVPLFQKRVHYLSMIANVATLLGLLGTIHGLILSFAAVATADPSQKQALLANGISVSMYTTALGLAVAIPVMICYSFIFSRQNELTEQMVEKVSKLVETLIRSNLPELSHASAYPNSVNTEHMPPPVTMKAG